MIEKLKELIREAFCGERIRELEEQLFSQISNSSEWQEKYDTAQFSLDEINKAHIETQIKFMELKKKFETKDLTPVDLWCIKNKKKPVRRVYKDKIIINGVKIPCDLREMITPNSYIVKKARESIRKTTDKKEWYSRVMRKVHSMVTWTSDGRFDNYYYPCYTLTTGYGDCDDFSFAQDSIETEMGNAFGYYRKRSGQRIGHSFSIGIIDGVLWVFDSVGNITMKYNHNKESKFYIHYIITKNQVYQLDGSVEFGKILWG